MTKGERRAKKPEERRAEILEAARRLFAEKGYDATCVSDIVRSIGVAQGTFYWYFRSKEEVFYEVARLYAEGFLEKVEKVAARKDLSALEKLVKLVEVFFGEREDWERELVERLHTPTERALHDRIAQEYSMKLLPLLVSVIRQGVEEGVFGTDYPEEAAAFLLAMGNLQTVLNPAQIEERLGKRWAMAYIHFMMRGLGCEDDVLRELEKSLQVRFSDAP